MTTSIGQPGQAAYGIPAKANDAAKQIKSLVQTLNATRVQVATVIGNVSAIAQAAAADPLAANLTSTSALAEGTEDELPASAVLGDVFLLDGEPPALYMCTTAYTSSGTLADDWTLDTDPRTMAVVTSLFATSRALTKTLGAYQTTLSGSAASGTPAANQRWVQITPWPVTQDSAVAAAWDGTTGSWVSVTQTGGEWPDWVNFAFANAIAANIGNLFASYATIGTATSLADAAESSALAASLRSNAASTLGSGVTLTVNGSVEVNGGEVIAVSGSKAAALTSGAVEFSNGSNTVSLIADSSGAQLDIGGSLDVQASLTVAGAANFAGDSIQMTAAGQLTAVNAYTTAQLHGNTVWIDNTSGGGTTGATIGNLGQIIRTSSSAELKTAIRDLGDSLPAAQVRKLRPRSFISNGLPGYEDGAALIGFTAQEAALVDERLVTRRGDTGELTGVRYEVLCAAQQVVLEDQEARIAALEATVAALTAGNGAAG